ncbi:MAG: protease modulator HflK, partial [Sphingomonadales bacterium]|nr:protease modulator HflK [Sphingomonadales bacterium]
MSIYMGWGSRIGAFFSDKKGPWGSSSGSDGPGGDDPAPPSKGPWGDSPGRGSRPRADSSGRGSVSSLDDFLKKNRDRFGGTGGTGGGGGAGGLGRPDPKILYWGLLGFVLLWLLFTTMHRIAPEERGVVTRFGRYSHTLSPGIGITLPSPIDRVTKVDVENIREVTLGSAAEETLMLTGDQNIIDIAYQVRWNIRNPEQYLFELAQPDDTIKQVAESAMRATIAQVSLQDAIGNRRGEIESLVAEEMERT